MLIYKSCVFNEQEVLWVSCFLLVPFGSVHPSPKLLSLLARSCLPSFFIIPFVCVCSVLIVIFIPDISNQFLTSFFLDQLNLEDCCFNRYFHEMSFRLIDFFFFHHLSSFYLIIAQSSLRAGLWSLLQLYPRHTPSSFLLYPRVSRALVCDIAYHSCLRGSGACVFD